MVQETDIDLNNTILVLYFYTIEMPFYSKMLHIFSKIQQQYAMVEYLAIDCDDFPGQCARFSVSSVPTLLALSNGKEMNRSEDLIKTRNLIKFFDDICIMNPINGESYA